MSNLGSVSKLGSAFNFGLVSCSDPFSVSEAISDHGDGPYHVIVTSILYRGWEQYTITGMDHTTA